MSHFFVFQETPDADEFVRLYEDGYYLDKGNCSQIAPNASGTRFHIETMIDNVLVEGIRSKLDVVHILAWKMSKFKQKESETGLVFSEDWEELNGIGEDGVTPELCVRRYGNTFQIGKIAGIVFDNIKRLEAAAKVSWQEALREVNDLLKDFYGLGPVYLITLVYFISRGAYPIYDQFAMMALSAIEQGIAPGGYVEYRGLTTVRDLLERDDPKFGYGQYCRRLSAIFGTDFRDRSVDRALWVYGHYFKPVKPKTNT